MSIKTDKISLVTKVDPTEFDVTVTALLVGLGAEKYIEIFKKRNIGQCTLAELSEEDLIKLGVDDPEVRTKLIEEVKNLPFYDESKKICNSNLGLIDIVDVVEESSNHLYKIYLSIMANTLALKKTNKISDCLLYKDKYASDIALTTVCEITNILNSMDIALHTQLKMLKEDSNRIKKKKILVGTVGGAVIAVLAVFFVRSLKNIT